MPDPDDLPAVFRINLHVSVARRCLQLFPHLPTFPLFFTELHHSVKPMTIKTAQTKLLIQAKAATILVTNWKYTTLESKLNTQKVN